MFKRSRHSALKKFKTEHKVRISSSGVKSTVLYCTQAKVSLLTRKLLEVKYEGNDQKKILE